MIPNKQNQIKIAGGLTALAGLWLLVAPFFYSLTGGAEWNQLFFGAVLLLAGVYELINTKTYYTSWLAGLTGVWLVVSPYIFNTPLATTRSEIIVGIVALVSALWDGVTVTRLKAAHDSTTA